MTRTIDSDNERAKDIYRLLTKYNHLSVEKIAVELSMYNEAIISDLFYYCKDSKVLNKLIQATELNINQSVTKFLNSLKNGQGEFFLNGLGIDSLIALKNNIIFYNLSASRTKSLLELIDANINLRSVDEQEYLGDEEFRILNL